MIRKNEFSFELELLFEWVKSKYKRHKISFSIIYVLTIFYLSIPIFQIPLLEYKNVRFTGVMEQRTINNFFIYFPLQNWCSYDDISNYFKGGIIAMEDGNFILHRGIDWDAMFESQRANDRRGKVVRGGSTITMQLAKNIYYTTRRSYFRKAKEILTAIRMEKELSKERIFELYLNIIELGRGIFGIETASQAFFNKDNIELSAEKAARIIAVIPSPIKHKPTDNSGYVLRRTGRVLGRMYTVVYP